MDQHSFLELGKYLREKRLNKKLTQVEVAASLGYSSQFIANWERGISSPPLDTFKKIVDIYGISSKEFYETMTSIQKDFWQRNIFNKKAVKKAK